MTGPYPPSPPPYGPTPQSGPPGPPPAPPGPPSAPYAPPPGYGPPPGFEQPPAYGPPPGFEQPPGFGAPPAFTPPPAKSNRGLVIGLVSAAAVLAVLCVAGIVATVWFLHRGNAGPQPADGGEIAGLIDYRTTHPDWLERDHLQDGDTPTYNMKPAAGGRHFGIWQRCAGDVYAKPVIEGRAVHSLEHGAVWITYRPGLAQADVDRLAAKVRNNDFMLMSPYEDQPSAISLQAWGYQLRVERADDKRVDAFIRRFRETASLEPGTPCSNGVAE